MSHPLGLLGRIRSEVDDRYFQEKRSLYTDTNDMHYHECPECHAVWQHPDGGGSIDCNQTRHGRTDSHACPTPGCKGRDTWKKPLKGVVKIDFPWDDRMRPEGVMGVGPEQEQGD